MNHALEYDAVVVGAGPAGSMAAAALAAEGFSVLMLEKHREVGIPLCCAEAVSLRSLRLFMEPDLSWVAANINGASLCSPDGTEVSVPWPGVGVVLERKLFDRFLAQRAAQAGADVMMNAEAVGLVMDGGIASGVVVERTGVRQTFSCRLVIGADGIESLTGAWAGMDTRLGPGQLHTCAQYLMAGVDVPADRVRFWVGNQVAPGGYAWVFPKGQGRANVGLGIEGARAEKTKPIQYLNRFVEKYFPHARIIETMVGGTPALGDNHPMAKGNVLLAGDAARLTDSLSGAGIAVAMASGDLAGRLGAEYLKSGDRKILEAYPAKWWAGPWKDLKFHHRVRDVFLKLSDAEMDRTARLLARILEGKDPAKLNPIDVAKTVITSDLGILTLARHLL
jgi:digeranylgeranylglycerophospholipid reductase